MKTFLTIVISMIGIVSAQADTIPSFKLPKNQIEFSLSSINYMDGYGYKTSSIYDKEIRFGDICLSYTRHFENKYFATLSYFRYSRNNYMQIRNQRNHLDINKGEILRKYSYYLILKFGQIQLLSLSKNLQGYIKPSIELLYGYGSDHIFLASYPAPNPFDFASVGVETKGFGLGIGTELGLIFYKHFSFSTSFNYTYIFERGKYEELSPPNPEYYKYTPSRNILIFQPKIGFLF